MRATGAMRAPTPGLAAETDQTGELTDLLNRLRFFANACRAESRLDLFEACRTLDRDRAEALDAYAAVLARVIGQALERPMVFHRVGTPSLSFDETWLLRLIGRARAGDRASMTFLIASRVAAPKRWAFGELVRSLAHAWPQDRAA